MYNILVVTQSQDEKSYTPSAALSLERGVGSRDSPDTHGSGNDPT